MTGPTGLVNFFVLEGSDYVEQLDSLLRAAGPSGPDADAFTRAARALRGSATMARRNGIAALAAAVERIGRALRERVLPWTPAMNDSLTGAVADLRQLVRTALDWTEADEVRAQARTAELLAFAPPSMRAAARTPAVPAGSGTMFVISGATDVASALTAASSRPGKPELLADALRRVRAFRGVAALRDHPAIAAALDPVEKVARAASTHEGAPTSPELAVLSTGARLLRRLAEHARAGEDSDSNSPEALAFAEAVSRHESAHGDADRIVPVSSLYYEDDGPHVVRMAPAPGTTAAERYTLESAATAEHLRRLLADPRQRDATGANVTSSDQALASTAATLVELARSFDHGELADALQRALASPGELDNPAARIALSAADAVAALFTVRGRTVEELTRRVTTLASGRSLGELVAVGYAQIAPAGGESLPTPDSSPAEPHSVVATDPTPPEPEPVPEPEPEPTPTPVPSPLPPPSSLPTPAALPAVAAHDVDSGQGALGSPHPTGRQLHALLASSIEGIERMRTPSGDDMPTAQIGDDIQAEPVPIGSLLYRGRAALGRALELRDEMRQHDGSPSKEQLEELFDLIDLAASA